MAVTPKGPRFHGPIGPEKGLLRPSLGVLICIFGAPDAQAADAQCSSFVATNPIQGVVLTGIRRPHTLGICNVQTAGCFGPWPKMQQHRSLKTLCWRLQK